MMALTTHERRYLAEMTRRGQLRQRVLDALHKKQRAFALDPSKRITAHCSRRSGKSHGIVGRLYLAAIDNPGELSVFIAISAARALELVELALRTLGAKIGWMPRKTVVQGSIYFEFPNGHRLHVAGCSNRADAEKFRGPRYAAAAIDEADSIRGHLQYLVTEVLEPALMDLDGWIALTGTPGATLAGFFYEATTGANNVQQWSTWHWTLLDNPFLRDPAGWLRRRCLELGLDENSPTYRREYLGDWVRDVEALVYQYSGYINSTHEELLYAESDWRHILAIDFGVVDATAFVASAYRTGEHYRNPQEKVHWTNLPIHLLESASWVGLSPSEAYYRLREWLVRYPGARLVGDTGGQGKAFVQEWSSRFGIYVEPAKKLGALEQIAFCNGMLRGGVVKAHLPGCQSLVREWSSLPWNEHRTGPEASYADHESAAARYGLIAARPNWRQEPDEPEVGTPEWHALRERRTMDDAIEAAAKRARMRR